MAQVSVHRQGRTVWAEITSGPLKGFTRGGKSNSDALRNMARALVVEEGKLERAKTNLRNLQRHVDKLVDRTF